MRVVLELGFVGDGLDWLLLCNYWWCCRYISDGHDYIQYTINIHPQSVSSRSQQPTPSSTPPPNQYQPHRHTPHSKTPQNISPIWYNYSDNNPILTKLQLWNLSDLTRYRIGWCGIVGWLCCRRLGGIGRLLGLVGIVLGGGCVGLRLVREIGRLWCRGLAGKYCCRIW